jgi:phage-related protein (TIGR01555 family)
MGNRGKRPSSRSKSVHAPDTAPAEERADSWRNVWTGLGDPNRDKGKHNHWHPDVPLDPYFLDSLFHGDDMAEKIVAKRVDEAMRQGFGIVAPKGTKPEEAAKRSKLLVDALGKRWKIRSKAHEGAVWGRLFGGGVILVGVNDGKLQREPLDWTKIRPGQLRWMMVLDRRDFQPISYYDDSDRDEKYGEPKIYLCTPAVANPAVGAGTPVHESRMITFPGVLTSRRKKIENHGWDHSALQRVYEVLRKSNTAWDSIMHMMNDVGQGVVKIKNLMKMIAMGQGDIVRERMQIMDEGRSVVRSVILDADGEDFDRKVAAVAGLEQIIDRVWIRVAAAADMPVTKLMGISPGGLNATGEHDDSSWDNTVQHFRDTVLLERVEALVHLVARDLGFEDAAEWGVKFPPLKQMTALEEANLRKLVADTDGIYIDKQVSLPEEVAIHRASEAGEVSVDFPPIDVAAREAMLERSLEEKQNPPDPAPQPQPGADPGQGGAQPQPRAE